MRVHDMDKCVCATWIDVRDADSCVCAMWIGVCVVFVVCTIWIGLCAIWIDVRECELVCVM